MPKEFTGGYSELPDRLGDVGQALWAVHYRASQRRAAGEDIIMLSIGEPDMATPEPIVEVAERSLRAGRTHYSPAEGEPEFLEALSQVYSKRTGRQVVPGQTVYSPGTHTALYLICQTLLNPGDDLLLPEPFYAAYMPVLAITGANLVPVPLRADNGFHLEIDDLRAAITPNTKALILNNPHNPTGAVLTPQRVREVAEVCHAHDVWVIADEVYEHLVYRGEFASPFDLDEYADGVAVASSLSKSHAMAGWRSGWAVGPEELMTRVRRVGEAMMFGAQPFLQDAAAYALTASTDVAAEMCAIYEKRAEMASAVFEGSELVIPHPPEAGVFVMVDIRPTGLTGTEFANGLLDECDVAAMPGESFGASAAGHLRVSLTVPDEALVEGCVRLREFAEAQAQTG